MAPGKELLKKNVNDWEYNGEFSKDAPAWMRDETAENVKFVAYRAPRAVPLHYGNLCKEDAKEMVFIDSVKNRLNKITPLSTKDVDEVFIKLSKHVTHAHISGEASQKSRMGPYRLQTLGTHESCDAWLQQLRGYDTAKAFIHPDDVVDAVVDAYPEVADAIKEYAADPDFDVNDVYVYLAPKSRKTGVLRYEMVHGPVDHGVVVAPKKAAVKNAPAKAVEEAPKKKAVPLLPEPSATVQERGQTSRGQSAQTDDEDEDEDDARSVAAPSEPESDISDAVWAKASANAKAAQGKAVANEDIVKALANSPSAIRAMMEALIKSIH